MILRGGSPIALAIGVLLGCSGQVAEHPTRDIGAEVETFLASYMDAISARDTALIRQSLADDDRFAWLEDGEVRYRRSTDLLLGLDQLPPGSVIRTDLHDLQVVPVGEVGAHAWAQFQTTVGEGVSAFAFGGAISFVLERRGDSWMLIGGHTSAPRPRGN